MAAYEQTEHGPGVPAPAAASRPWLRAYPPAVPHSYPYPQVPLSRLLDDAARDFPQAVATSFGGATLTYRELLDRVDRFATALTDLGVVPGQRVGVLLPNCPQHVVAVFAILRIGAVVVELDHRLGPEVLEARLNAAGCVAVVCLDTVYGTLATLKGRLTFVRHIVATRLAAALPFPRNLVQRLRGRGRGSGAAIPAAEGVHGFEDLIARTAPIAVQAPVRPEEDLALVCYPTARAAAAVSLSHANVVAGAFQGRLWIPDVQAGREDVLCARPFTDGLGFTMGLALGVLAAAGLTLLPTVDGDAAVRAVAARRSTLLSGGSAFFEALAAAAEGSKHDLSSVRVALVCGQGPIHDVARRIEAGTGAKVRQCFGVAEASALTHANPVYGRAKAGSIGLPVPDTACALVDLDDPRRLAPTGRPGRLAIAGPQVALGDRHPAVATEDIGRPGWLLTDVVATLDDEGYFAVTGRAPGPRV